jgi:hypothetical protein
MGRPWAVFVKLGLVDVGRPKTEKREQKASHGHPDIKKRQHPPAEVVGIQRSDRDVHKEV